MTIYRHKVFAYITNRGRLLVFTHPLAPEAGVQVPAGTIEEGEDPDVVVLREAWEETGLHELTLVGLLGERVFDASPLGRDELNVCRFYHLRCAGDPPDLWTHFERYPSDGTTVPIPFDFFWARLPHEAPALIADHDSCLPQLLAAMETDLTSYSSEHQG